MLHKPGHAGPMPGEARPTDPGRVDERLVQLQEQERLWFSWVTILHERLDKADMRDSHDVLEIAKQRWLDAKEALREYQAGH